LHMGQMLFRCRHYEYVVELLKHRQSLQVEIGEMPLNLRRKQLMANYWANLQGHNNAHPAKTVLQAVWEIGRSQKDNFGQIGNDIAREFKVFSLKISPSVVYPLVAPWTLVWPEVYWYLLDLKRGFVKCI